MWWRSWWDASWWDASWWGKIELKKEGLPYGIAFLFSVPYYVGG